LTAREVMLQFIDMMLFGLVQDEPAKPLSKAAAAGRGGTRAAITAA
jgi:hypothetical protein